MTLTRTRVRLITAGVLLGGLAVAAVVYLRTMCRPGWTPQLDVPLWRGTDLPDPGGDLTHETWDEWTNPDSSPYCPECGCLDTHTRRCRYADPDAWPLPADELPPGLTGAILGLAYARTEAEARGWLQTCADRGATWQLQRDLWDTWQDEHRPNVVYLDPPEDRP
jgi:hypothetical protein